ncbi:hypothetical protein N5M55_004435 [Vibrio vulnificus]|uniref:Uncharacterized protein n=2 Tax=Vibrio vulnificus TaxID=672 RepID=A0AAN1UBQ2_VIBVL|nr:hypothetical protein FORC53_1251 [Vibrio vulnificus]EKO3695204.1 hypothetical protein [Vibrio metschnikovii]EJA3105469.1 hypothetical protein [Vibrio vulnificus]EJX1093097.1 hypothetical protein [Vibrio vulnificus]EKO3892484.1 hypothetical protein [Vibrio metschnikovii]
MELLGHSITHYNGKKELDRKLLILHLANAVELVLKDLVLDTGESIYKGPKETITIQGCLKVLQDKSINLPLLNKIELLVDERNALQHRFGSPNELTSIFYMNIAENFFREVLKTHYGQEYDEIVTQFTDESDLLEYKLNDPTNDQELDKLKDLAKIHPLGALLSAWTYIEKEIEEFAELAGLNFLRRRPSVIDLVNGRWERFGVVIPSGLSDSFNEARRLRNMAAHGRLEPTVDDVIASVDTIEAFEKYLLSLDKSIIKQSAQIERERLEKERQEYLDKRTKEKQQLEIIDLFGNTGA